MEWTDKDQEEQDKYMELRQSGHDNYDARVLSRTHNAPMPDSCPKCGGELASGGGMVGETVLFCPNKDCETGMVWEDHEGAIARVL